MPKTFAIAQSNESQSKFALLLLLIAWLGVVAGCRSTTDNQIDLLERELRVQENYIYELEDYVVEYSEKLRNCRSCYPQQPAVYSEEVYDSAPAAERSQDSHRRDDDEEKSILDREPDDGPSIDDRRSTEELSPEDLEVPDELDLEMDDPVGQSPRAASLQQVAAAAIEEEWSDSPVGDDSFAPPDPVEYRADSEEAKFISEPNDDAFIEELFADDQLEETVAVVDRVAERLEVTRLFHGAGDEKSPLNLLAVVEALDASNEPVDLDGEVSLMVMTADQASPQRLKRWNFTAEETISAWQSSDLGDGLHLELPLDKLQLPAAPLELWVRLVTADGRKLLTQLPFEFDQLTDIASATPQPPQTGLALVKVPKQSEKLQPATPVNSLRIETQPIPNGKRLELAGDEQLANQPRWRASMQRTDRTSSGFATSASKSSGWTTQRSSTR